MSQFLKQENEYSIERSQGIDFDEAVRLPGGGSTCDIYKTRWQRRDVIVKRLKEPLRSKPLYLDALDKEFDIGVNLRHPSLPDYREFHRDYIIMDYIDGETLAVMIKRNDPWLTKEKNIVAMLRELIDVVDYLHRHNVVHCDIKPDNIMITTNNHNLVLIDFDKSYTDALGDTSGHPAKYGLTKDEKGRVAIDFRGIGMLVERLKSTIPGFKLRGYKQFVKTCYRTDVNCEELRDLLDTPYRGQRSQRPSDRLTLIVGTAIIAAGLLIAYLGELTGREDEPQTNPTEEVIEKDDASDKEEVIEKNDVSDKEEVIEKDDVSDKEVEISTPKTETSEQSSAPRTQAEIHEDAKNKAAALDQEISQLYNKLHIGLDRLIALKEDTTLTGPQLLDSIRRHSDIEDAYFAETFEILNEMFPGLTDRAQWRIMAYSKAYTGYTRRAGPELREYGYEIARRYKAEGLSLP
ncbi:MAG: protein kinase [Paramuribaculum sp.]|nr:protein kinase [Paramuribaculum sp.]